MFLACFRCPNRAAAKKIPTPKSFPSLARTVSSSPLHFLPPSNPLPSRTRTTNYPHTACRYRARLCLGPLPLYLFSLSLLPPQTNSWFSLARTNSVSQIRLRTFPARLRFPLATSHQTTLPKKGVPFRLARALGLLTRRCRSRALHKIRKPARQARVASRDFLPRLSRTTTPSSPTKKSSRAREIQPPLHHRRSSPRLLAALACRNSCPEPIRYRGSQPHHLA